MSDETPPKPSPKTIAFELCYQELDMLYQAFLPAVARAKAVVYHSPVPTDTVPLMEALLERLNQAGNLFP